MLKWKRDGKGRQVSDDGKYAVQSDGYSKALLTYNYRGEDHEFGQGGEWCAINLAQDENMDWFPSMKEAKAYCQTLADEASRERVAMLESALQATRVR